MPMNACLWTSFAATKLFLYPQKKLKHSGRLSRRYWRSGTRFRCIHTQRAQLDLRLRNNHIRIKYYELGIKAYFIIHTSIFMQIGYIGLGKMGLAQVERLLKKGYRVVAWNRSAGPRETARKLGAEVNGTLQEVCRKIKKPRLLWLMVPHAVVDDIIQEIVLRLSKGDTVIDGGNSFYKDSMRRAKELSRKGINFLDVGTSGGPFGALNGACLMIGGDKKVFRRCEPLFRDLSAHLAYSIIRANNGISSMRSKKSGTEEGDYAYAYIGKNGAGHFVKIVHNGIEYGMMQAIGEGFAVLKKSQFALDLQQIAELYNKVSVVESRLMGWLAKAFTEHGENF